MTAMATTFGSESPERGSTDVTSSADAGDGQGLRQSLPELSSFDPVAYLSTPRWRVSRLGLDRMVDLLDRMGSPQDDLRFVHIAGTNGKGSVCAYLASALTCAGYRTGLFTSPYVDSFEERISVDGTNISQEDLTSAVRTVRDKALEVESALGDHPTEFELMFASALAHFRATDCDIVVCEVGLGGRLDATNAIDEAEVSVITRIGLDHTELLGDTLSQVAAEKAGIIKPSVPVVSFPQAPDAARVIAQVADDQGCLLSVPDFSQLEVGHVDPGFSERPFRYEGVPYKTRLLGSYQPQNAVLAIEAVKVLCGRGWAVSQEALTAGIRGAFCAARFEVLARHPLVIVDGAHNPQGADALVESLSDMLGNRACHGVVFVMGVLADKDFRAMIEAVLPCARAFVVYAPDNERALAADELAQAIEDVFGLHTGSSGCMADEPVCVQTAPSAVEAMTYAYDLAGRDDVIVAFGSLYSAAGIRAAAVQCR